MDQVISPSLRLRIMSSLVLIPLVISALALGGWIYALCIATVVAIAFAEWLGLATKLGDHILVKALCIIIGTLYLAASFGEMIVLRVFMDSGFFMTLGLLFTVWSSDTGAYIFGKCFGGAKLCPTISPNKTWAGLWGAVVGPAIILSIWFALIPIAQSAMDTPQTASFETLALCALGGAIMGGIGQIGDLSISLLKRRAHVKDTGNLIPGHGGILDRIDSLLLVLPAYLLFAKYVLAS